MARLRACVPGGGAAAVDPVVASTLADDSNQTNGYSYAPTLSISAGAAGGTWSTVGVRTSDDAAVSVTGNTTTTPTATLTAADVTLGESWRMASTYTVGSLTDTFTSVVRVAATGGASWSTLGSIDFTSDVTDLTLTKGAGDTNLRNAANDTTKAVVGYADRIATTVSTAVCTAASGKFLLTSDSGSVSTKASYVYVKLTESGTGIDWSDPAKTYAIDLVISGAGFGSNGDIIFVGIGTDSAGIAAGSWYGMRLDRDGASDFVDAGRRWLGSGENGANQNSSATVITDRAMRLVVSRGVVGDVHWQTGTTPLEGFPTASGSVFKSFIGSRSLGIEASPETTLGATFYVIVEAFSTSASDVVCGIETIRVQEFS